MSPEIYSIHLFKQRNVKKEGSIKQPQWENNFSECLTEIQPVLSLIRVVGLKVSAIQFNELIHVNDMTIN